MALDVELVAVRGVWWRHIPHRGKVRHRPVPPPDNRWQHGRVVEGFYLASDAPTVWAEWYRLLAELAVPPDRQMPRNLWRWTISETVADLSTEDRLSRVGLRPLPPSRFSWPAYQDVGDQLFREGWSGLVAPSAARPGEGKVLCLFRTAEDLPGAARCLHREWSAVRRLRRPA